ncbi:hypothetical protein HY78_03545 [Rhizorhabdus wittichii DC-6]|nr:hypothetical protein HY78_03545 [Rhizorhabdus wittichii DC-6]
MQKHSGHLTSSRLSTVHLDDTAATISKVIENAPDWLRQDLTSKDAGLRTRAEETLAAMIVAGLQK